MGEFAAEPTTQLAVQRPSAPTISVVILQILINITSLEPGRFSVQKARMINQLRGARYEHLRVVPPEKRLRVPSCTRPDILGSG